MLPLGEINDIKKEFSADTTSCLKKYKGVNDFSLYC